MSVKYTVLGFLSWKSQTGYEIKKHFKEVDFIPWQGNNNQIYKVLTELYNEGCISKKVIPQEALPSQKLYSITDKGLTKLKKWVLSKPLLPEFKNPFLMQLAWASTINNDDLFPIIDKYQQELEEKINLLKEKLKTKKVNPSRDKKEAYIWDMLWMNNINLYQNQLDWIIQYKKWYI